MKSKILALSVIFAIGSAIQAMENRIESETLLTFENKTQVTARIKIGGEGYDDYGCFRRSFYDHSIAPNQIYKFKVCHLPGEFTFPYNRKESMVSSYYGLVAFNEEEPYRGGIIVEWKNFYPKSNIVFVFNEEKNKYEVNEK